ncbi:hypothetical protein ABKV19_019276 [Rosa sericea]
MAAKPEKMEIRRHLRDENGEGQASGPISDIEKDPEIRSRRWRHLEPEQGSATSSSLAKEEHNKENEQ